MNLKAVAGLALTILASGALHSAAAHKLDVQWMTDPRNISAPDKELRARLLPILEPQVECEGCAAANDLDLEANHKARFSSQLSVAQAVLRAPGSTEALAVMYVDGMTNCYTNRSLVLDLDHGLSGTPKTLFEREIPEGNGGPSEADTLGVLSIAGQTFLSSIEHRPHGPSREAANYDQILYVWNGRQFTKVFRALSQFMSICGTGNRGGFSVGKIGVLNGQLALFEWYREADQDYSGIEHDMRIKKTMLKWDPAAKKISKGATEYLPWDAVDHGD